MQYDSLLAGVTGVELIDSTAEYGAGETSLPLVCVSNAHGRALVALQGAHVLSFVPAGKRDLLWVSPKAIFAPGKAVRGGIPLCMPWFGAGGEGRPAHGFARSSIWTLASAENHADGSTTVSFTLQDSDATRALWPHAFAYRLDVRVAAAMTLTLTAEHKGDVAVPFTAALHTYFTVSDVQAVRVEGLEGATFIDTLGGANTRHVQEGAVTIGAGPIDSIYVNVAAEQRIVDTNRTIRIDSPCKSSVVWNCGAETAAKMADVGAGNHLGYLCVECADTADNALTLAPGQTYTTTMTLSA
ncbi:D-hexose-6-phosphate mutarotase [Chitinibacteraceae bacterium HSL-7]